MPSTAAKILETGCHLENPGEGLAGHIWIPAVSGTIGSLAPHVEVGHPCSRESKVEARNKAEEPVSPQFIVRSTQERNFGSK